jgi:hypothetical protein
MAAVHREGSLGGVDAIFYITSGVVRVRQVLLNTWFEEREVCVAPAIQWQILDLLLLHHSPDIRRLTLQQRRGFVNFNHLGDLADLQCEVDRGPRLNVDLYVVDDLRREPVRRRFHRIDSRAKTAELILAGVVRPRGQCNAGSCIRRRQGSAKDRSSTGIVDRSDDRPCIELTKTRARQKDRRHDCKGKPPNGGSASVVRH